jgi:hypothetical protein
MRWIGFCGFSVVRISSAPTERAAATWSASTADRPNLDARDWALSIRAWIQVNPTLDRRKEKVIKGDLVNSAVEHHLG